MPFRVCLCVSAFVCEFEASPLHLSFPPFFLSACHACDSRPAHRCVHGGVHNTGDCVLSGGHCERRHPGLLLVAHGRWQLRALLRGACWVAAGRQAKRRRKQRNERREKESTTCACGCCCSHPHPLPSLSRHSLTPAACRQSLRLRRASAASPTASSSSPRPLRQQTGAAPT